jgi:hypothetical protein
MTTSKSTTIIAWGAVLAMSWASPATAPASEKGPAWPDTFVSRVEVLALLETFDAELLSHDSATLTLEHWCDVHRLASPPRVVAERVPLDKPLPPEEREVLGIGAAETVKYRRVRLVCGPVVLSEADNWYLPARLTPEMNERLDTTDVPFGKVVLGLHFQRRTLSSKLLWRPLPEGWEMRPRTADRGAGTLVLPQALLENRAVLTLPDGTPFSEVVETYSSGILAFAPPRP